MPSNDRPTIFTNVNQMHPKSSLRRVLILCLWILSWLMVVDGTRAQDDSTLGHWKFERGLIEGHQLRALVGAGGTIQPAFPK